MGPSTDGPTNADRELIHKAEPTEAHRNNAGNQTGRAVVATSCLRFRIYAADGLPEPYGVRALQLAGLPWEQP